MNLDTSRKKLLVIKVWQSIIKGSFDIAARVTTLRMIRIAMETVRTLATADTLAAVGTVT
jgi:hypothetical protein